MEPHDISDALSKHRNVQIQKDSAEQKKRETEFHTSQFHYDRPRDVILVPDVVRVIASNLDGFFDFIAMRGTCCLWYDSLVELTEKKWRIDQTRVCYLLRIAQYVSLSDKPIYAEMVAPHTVRISQDPDNQTVVILWSHVWYGSQSLTMQYYHTHETIEVRDDFACSGDRSPFRLTRIGLDPEYLRLGASQGARPAKRIAFYSSDYAVLPPEGTMLAWKSPLQDLKLHLVDFVKQRGFTCHHSLHEPLLCPYTWVQEVKEEIMKCHLCQCMRKEEEVRPIKKQSCTIS